MLVLSRRNQQQILIPELDIRITILGIGAGRVQLGIEAPRNIDITRPDAATTRCDGVRSRHVGLSDARYRDLVKNT